MPESTLDFAPTRLGGELITYPVAFSALALDSTNKPPEATAALMWLWPEFAPDYTQQTVSLTVTTPGDATLSFERWASVGAQYAMLFTCWIDGTLAGSWEEDTPWVTESLAITGAGTHTIEWRLKLPNSPTGPLPPGSLKGSRARAGIAMVHIDNVLEDLAAPSPAPTLHDLEDGVLPAGVTTDGWTVSTDGPISGTRSLRSPTAPEDRGEYLVLIDPGSTVPTLVEFDWRVSCEEGDGTYHDSLYAYNADWNYMKGFGDRSGEDSGHSNLIVGAGAGLMLAYGKNPDGSGGADAAWVDNLAFVYVPSAQPIRFKYWLVGENFELPSPVSGDV